MATDWRGVAHAVGAVEPAFARAPAAAAALAANPVAAASPERALAELLTAAAADAAYADTSIGGFVALASGGIV